MSNKKTQEDEEVVSWVYKGQRGRVVRWVSVGTFFFLTLFGLRNLYVMVNAAMVGRGGWWVKSLVDFHVPVMDERVEVTIGLLIVVALGAAAGYGLLWLFFHHARVSEFMIDTETEMRKVSWPAWQELKGSTIAVVVAVALLSLYLLLVDMVLSNLLDVLMMK